MAEEKKSGMEIKVYGKQSCHTCTDAKTNIKTCIEQNNLGGLVTLIEKDIENDVEALAEYTAFGTQKFPVIVFKDFSTGMSTKGIGIAPSIDYLKDYFKNKGYIQG